MGCYHTKIHACITVTDDPAYLRNFMARQYLTAVELHELNLLPATNEFGNPAVDNVLVPLNRCA
jgi:hypothetical protein